MRFSRAHQNNLLEVLRWRRDVRHFRSEPIEPTVLAELEAAVDLAPSVGNSRPWRIVRVNDPRNRAVVIRSFEEQNHKAGSNYAEGERRKYLALKLAGLAEAPTHLCFFTDLEPAEGRGLGRQTMPETLVYSTVMAIHTLWLAARSRNIGVGWVSIMDPAVVTAALSVPQEWHLTGYLCLGYPKDFSDTPELDRAGWQPNVPSIWIDR